MLKLKTQWSKISLGARVGLGFFLVFVLGTIVIVIGMQQMSSTHARVDQFIHTDSIRVDLVHEMIDALNARTISVNHISREGDIFLQDEEYVKFSIAGGKFLSARDKLMQMRLSKDESNLLRHIAELAAEVHPDALRLIDAYLAKNKNTNQDEIIDTIYPKQRLIVALLSELLKIQEANAYVAANNADEAYSSAWAVMSVLSVILGIFGIVVVLVVIRLTNKQANMLSYQALYDSLTGLPNRSLFTDRLQQTIMTYKRAGKTFSLITMDLNLFKEINDTLGHQAGDEVLKHVARVGRLCLRESDTIARMGGDEFTIMLPSVQTTGGAVIVAQRLIEKLREPIVIHGRELEISASLGIAMFPRHADNLDDLQSIADAAMYQAKRQHVGYVIYSEEMGSINNDVLGLQSQLRKAISRNELILHYQPKIEFATRCISGVEALVRWQHPERGLLQPDSFIPVAENSELIRPITEYVLREATRQTAIWLAEGTELTVAVNVSAINIQDENFAGTVAKILQEAKLPARYLELELTESAVMSKPERAIDCIKKLHEFGVHVSIDDFGTGYTSMSQLKGLLVTKIKIDRSFVKNMAVSHSDAVIVRTAVDLSHNLGFKVVAEGVEDQVTWDKLETLGCDSAQGFHMGVPLAPDDFAEWLASSPWSKCRDV